MRRIIQFIYIFFIMTLTACSTIPSVNVKPIPTEPLIQASSWQKRQQILKQIQNWHVKGKIAIQTQQEAGSAMVNWTQRKQTFTISLLGPLGNPGLTLKGRPREVTLQTSDGKTMTATTPEILLLQVWGWRLPVAYLHDWIRGLPVPGIEAQTQFDALHRLSSLVQGEWRIQFQDYMKVGQVDLPSKLAISSSFFKTKLIIYNWEIN